MTSWPRWPRQGQTSTRHRTARAGLRLVERGARTSIYQAAALGLADRVQAELAGRPGPDPERITTAFWAASGGGHQDIAAQRGFSARPGDDWY